MKILIQLLLNTLALMIAAELLPGVHIDTWMTALVTAIVLGAINLIIKPILVVLSVPITVLTLGLFTLVVNGLLILLVTVIVPGFRVDSIWWAIGLSVVLSLISWVFQRLAR